MTPHEFIGRFKVPCFWHFTDARNLPSIRASGGLYSWQKLTEKNLTVTAPGGNEWSHDADRLAGMHNYVHLCLFNAHPMEYFARADGRIQQVRFLQIDPMILHAPGALFTSDVSNKSGIVPISVDDAISEMDFDVIYGSLDQWDPKVRERTLRARKYELLILDHVPLSLIKGV